MSRNKNEENAVAEPWVRFIREVHRLKALHDQRELIDASSRVRSEPTERAIVAVKRRRVVPAKPASVPPIQVSDRQVIRRIKRGQACKIAGTIPPRKGASNDPAERI